LIDSEKTVSRLDELTKIRESSITNLE